MILLGIDQSGFLVDLANATGARSPFRITWRVLVEESAASPLKWPALCAEFSAISSIHWPADRLR
jgi:hypothetical protein